MTIAAIPTRYAGVNFRSRLETRWATFFDLLGVSWEYEPIDLAGYIPDFILEGQILAEVKPCSWIPRRDEWGLSAEWNREADDHALRLLDVGFEGPCVLLGNGPVPAYHEAIIGLVPRRPKETREGYHPCDALSIDAWARKGEPRVPLLRPGRAPFIAVSGDGSAFWTRVGCVFPRYEHLRDAWREAGNRVQWNAVTPR